MFRFLVLTLFLALTLGFGSNAQATIILFTADLDGPSENPPNSSPGTGSALVTYDSVAHTLFIQAEWDDLIGTTTVAHIHCCVDPPGTVGVATYPGTFPGFPAGVTGGIYSSPTPIDLTDTSSYTSSFLMNFGGNTAAGAEAALVAGLLDGRAYFNIHSSFSPGGEIRGFLRRVPEPGTLGLLALGMVGALAHRARKTRRNLVL
jgi:hypothetical protein